MLAALVITAALSGCGCAVLAMIGRTLSGGLRQAGPAGGADLPPALVSFVLTRCAAGTQAYEATILDLAAREFLVISAGYSGWQVALPAAADSAAGGTGLAGFGLARFGLAGFEQQVLHDVSARLRRTGTAPFEVLADVCRADVRGTWDPFEAGLRADARRRGIGRPALPATAGTVALAGATTAAVAACAYLAARLVAGAPGAHGGAGGAVVTSAIAVIVFWSVLARLARHDRLTTLGSELAGQLRRDPFLTAGQPAAYGAAPWGETDPVWLRGAARAVAAGMPLAPAGRAGPAFPPAWSPPTRSLPARSRPARSRRGLRRPAATDRPGEVWSSFSGTWRPVRIRVSLGLGMGGGFALLAGAAWAGLIAYAVSIPGGTGPLPLILACLAIGLAAAFGLRELARLLAMPSRATFDGQVIARWIEEDNSENGTGRVPHIAVDDAQRAWIFAGGQVFARVALGDLVQVTVNPRSGKLIDLRVTSGERPAPAAATDAETPRDAEAPGDAAAAWSAGPAHEPLITEAEIAGLVGAPVRTTPVPGPGDFAMIVKGRDGTMSLVVVGGRFAALNTTTGRLAGTPVAGVGDHAWLLNKQRTVVARTGDRVVKLTVSRRRAAGPVPGRLVAVAAAVAERLTRRAGASLPR